MSNYQRLYRAWRTAYWLRSLGDKEHPGRDAAVAFMRALQADADAFPAGMRATVKQNFAAKRWPKPERFCVFHDRISPVIDWLLVRNRADFRTAREMRKSVKRRRARIAAHAEAMLSAYPRIKRADWRTAPEGKLFVRE